MKTREITIGEVRLGGGNGFVLIAGPCVIESPEKCMEAARLVKEVAAAARVPVIFKASFDKANRSSGTSYRGVSMKAGLQVFKAIKKELGLPVLTDIHEPAQCEPVADVVDVLQIPALLCRQTDLLIAAGQTGKPVNVKKGQFMAPGDMRNVVDKIKSTDNEDIILTERGTTFGYHYLVNDMRALPSMRKLGYPVVYDATHSVQLPGGAGNRSAGERHFVAPLARAAMAAGVDGLFLEVHPDPDQALSDGPNMLRIADLPPLLHVLKRIDEEVRAYVQAEDFEFRPPKPGAGNTLLGAVPRVEG
ncbi:MAG: 3-deoxy-8-phosphooctulonate synthase [Planctomycetes bacterium]|nr:3-deoxy-8-phosphooctulonate synthase [Planctomycetota bacterium]